MRPGESAAAFKRFAAGNGVKLARCTPRQGIEQMLAFFRDVKPLGCVQEEDGDMLLFQFGTFDWGEGRWFELDVTRQFLDLEHVFEDDGDDEDDEDDDGQRADEYHQPTMSQLSLTFRFKPTPELDALGQRNRWNEGRGLAPAFVSFVFDSAAMQLLADRRPDQVKVHHSLV